MRHTLSCIARNRPGVLAKITGARAPIVLTARADTAHTQFLSIAFAAAMAKTEP